MFCGSIELLRPVEIETVLEILVAIASGVVIGLIVKSVTSGLRHRKNRPEILTAHQEAIYNCLVDLKKNKKDGLVDVGALDADADVEAVINVTWVLDIGRDMKVMDALIQKYPEIYKLLRDFPDHAKASGYKEA